MSETNQTEFRGWARVEIMGHQTHIGFVTTETYGCAVMFRIDQPEISQREETLTASRWVDGADGDTVIAPPEASSVCRRSRARRCWWEAHRSIASFPAMQRPR